MALFVGRFQPFHLGHLDAIQQILQSYEKVIVVIGSAQESSTLENPFTAEEREQMIRCVLDAEHVPYELYTISDIPDDALWVSFLEEELPLFDAAFSGNERVLRLLEAGGKKTHKIVFNVAIDATTIRDKIRNGDDSWKEYLYPVMVEKFEDLIVDRISSL